MKIKRNSRGFAHHFIIPVLAVFAVGVIGLVTLNLSSASSRDYTVSRCKSIGTIRTGSKGSCVRVLQKSLNHWGKTSHLTVDGLFGGNTRRAVIAFQKSKHLKLVDGVVGSATWGALKPYSVTYTLPASKPKSNASGSSAKVSIAKCSWNAGSDKYSCTKQSVTKNGNVYDSIVKGYKTAENACEATRLSNLPDHLRGAAAAQIQRQCTMQLDAAKIKAS